MTQQGNKLRSQLDQEKAENAHLQADIRTLTADWTAAREQLQVRILLFNHCGIVSNVLSIMFHE